MVLVEARACPRLRRLFTKHFLILEVIHGLRLLRMPAALVRLLLLLWCSILLLQLVVVVESLGILGLSFLLEVFSAVSICFDLLNEVAEFRGFEEPHVLALAHIGFFLGILMSEALVSSPWFITGICWCPGSGQGLDSPTFLCAALLGCVLSACRSAASLALRQRWQYRRRTASLWLHVADASVAVALWRNLLVGPDACRNDISDSVGGLRGGRVVPS